MKSGKPKVLHQIASRSMIAHVLECVEVAGVGAVAVVLGPNRDDVRAEAATYCPEARFFTQTFCRTCGSAMPRVDPGRGIAVIPMGALDDGPGVTPREHIFVGSKAPWFEIADALPQHAEWPPKS